MLAVLGLSGLVVLSTGCATAVNVPLARRTEGLPSANRGQSSSAIFNTPAVANAMADTPEWVRPEYGRNDQNLAYADPRALTAIDTWPQVPPPTIAAQRRFTLNRNPQQIIIFTTPGAGRPFGGFRGGPVGRRGGFGYGNPYLYSPRPR
jgi:hypothetical protein